MKVQEIARSIADELREHPERWTKGAVARRADGASCGKNDPEVACLCLLGHIWLRGDPLENYYNLDTAFARLAEVESLALFNDDIANDVTDVIELCEKVANS